MDVLAPLAVVGLVFIGFFKGSELVKQAPVDLTLVFACIVIVSIGMSCLVSRGRFRLNALMLFFFATCVPAMLYATHNPGALDKRIRLFIPLLIVVGVFVLVQTYRRQQAWVWLHILVGVALVGGGTGSETDALARFSAAGSNTIAAGRASGVAIVCLVLLLLMGALRRWWLKLGAIGIILWLTAALIETGSRGPVLSCAAAILLVTLVTSGRGRAFRIAVGAATVSIGWLMLADATGIGANRITGSLSGEYSLTGSRRDLWVETLKAIPSNPLGVGWGNFYNELPSWALLSSGYDQYPHNVILEILIEAGWLSGLAAIAVLFVGLRQLVANTDHSYGAALLGIAIFFVMNAMVSGDLNDNRMMWASVAVSWVLKKPCEVGPRDQVRIE